MALEKCRPLTTPIQVGSRSNVTMPLHYEIWAEQLSDHPDRAFVSYIVTGLREGFRIGFNRAHPTSSAASNFPTTHKDVVHDYLSKKVALDRMFPLYPPLSQQIHVSPLGIIPKKNKPGKWHLIVDLSSPKGYSVNEGISPELASVHYASVDNLVSLVLQAGRGSSLVKADVKEAYCNIPVHPEDQCLLGVRWEGVVYVDKVLPFGLRSAPLILSAVADAAQWTLHQSGVKSSLHYLDDYVLVEKDHEQAAASKQKLCTLFHSLGIPLEPSKLEGPTRCLTFLGIEVDTDCLQLHLPAAKLERLLSELQQARGRRTLTKRELQSLTGLLQHASTVVRPGRAFLQRLYALQCWLHPQS